MVLAVEMGRLHRAGVRRTLAASFTRVDGEVVRGAAAGVDADVDEWRSRTVGSTAVVAVMGRRRIVVSNCATRAPCSSRPGWQHLLALPTWAWGKTSGGNLVQNSTPAHWLVSVHESIRTTKRNGGSIM